MIDLMKQMYFVCDQQMKVYQRERIEIRQFFYQHDLI